jgi:hypothetical protein
LLEVSPITEATWYRWKNTYGGAKANAIKRINELEAMEPKAQRSWWLI